MLRNPQAQMSESRASQVSVNMDDSPPLLSNLKKVQNSLPSSIFGLGIPIKSGPRPERSGQERSRALPTESSGSAAPIPYLKSAR